MSNQEAQPRTNNISKQQIAQASVTALSFFRMETTLIPGNIRGQLDVLEVVLTGLAQGKLVVASPDQLAVELPPNPTQEPDNGGSDKDTPEAETEKGREPTGPELPKANARVQQADSSAGSDPGTGRAE